MGRLTAAPPPFGGSFKPGASIETIAIRPADPPDPSDAFRRALDGVATAASVARVGLDLPRQHLDGGDLGADREPLLRNLADAADRLRDEVRTLNDLAHAVLGGADTIIRIK